MIKNNKKYLYFLKIMRAFHKKVVYNGNTVLPDVVWLGKMI